MLVGADTGPADAPQAFADAIRKVAGMTFGDLRASALERFSFEQMAERSLAVYRELARLLF